MNLKTYTVSLEPETYALHPAPTTPRPRAPTMELRRCRLTSSGAARKESRFFTERSATTSAIALARLGRRASTDCSPSWDTSSTYTSCAETRGAWTVAARCCPVSRLASQGAPTPNTRHHMSISIGVGHQQLQRQLLVVSCQLSVISCQLSVVSCQWLVVSYQLSVVSCQWLVVSCRHCLCTHDQLSFGPNGVGYVLVCGLEARRVKV